MATKEKNTSYNRAKDAFEALDLEDKAVFLIDAVFKTVLGGMEQFTTAVSDAVDDLTNRTYADGDSDDDETSADKTVKRQSAAKKSSTKKASTQSSWRAPVWSAWDGTIVSPSDLRSNTCSQQSDKERWGSNAGPTNAKFKMRYNRWIILPPI